MSSLNPEQEIAAAHEEGPMLVIAGPGTGKTATLTERYIRLLKNGISEKNILCITFTKKAADELKTRLYEKTKLPNGTISAGTFHHFALAIAKKLPEFFPRLTEGTLLEDQDALKIIQTLTEKYTIITEDTTLLEEIQGYKDQLLSPEDLLKKSKQNSDQDLEIFAKLYKDYTETLHRQKKYDFGDILKDVIDELKTNKDLRESLSQKYRYIMIDEYQDLNKAQFIFTCLLLECHNNLWVVGDDDQSLYEWRHSNIDYILNFKKYFPTAKIQALTKNYRSQKNVLKLANSLIQKNKHRFNKTIEATHTDEIPIILHESRTPESEAYWIAQTISKLIEKGHSPKEIAILSRTTESLTYVEKALKEYNVSYTLNGPNFWENLVIKKILSCFDFLSQGHYKFLIKPEKISPYIVKTLEQKKRGNDFKRLGNLITTYFFENPPKYYSGEKKYTWKFLIEEFKREFEKIKTPEDLKTLVQNNIYKKSDPEKSVQCLSFHSSKGLEWNTVFLMSLEKGIIPHEKSNNLEEERRLIFVGITRAKKNLYLSYAKERYKKERQESPYLTELKRSFQKPDLLLSTPNTPLFVETFHSIQSEKKKFYKK